MSLDNDSDSDDDNFFAPRAFPKSKNNSISTVDTINVKEIIERIAAGQPITPINKKPKKGRKRQQQKKSTVVSKKSKQRWETNDTAKINDRHNDPQWIENQAHRTVEEELILDVADKISDLQDIGWIRDTKNKKLFYPAILPQNHTVAKILLKDRKKFGRRSTIKPLDVQYIGATWKDALKYTQIPCSRWISFADGTNCENEKRLESFVKYISKLSLFKDNLLAVKTEEYAVRKIMWEKVQTQQEEKRRRQEEEKETVGVSATASPVMVSQEDLDHSSSFDSFHDNKDVTEAATEMQDSESDDADLPSPGRRKKRKALLLDDEIEFHHVLATHGDPSQLQRAHVIGIRPDNPSYPLLLSNAIIPLPSSHLVRCLPDGNWRPIKDFLLRKAGIQNIAKAGMNTVVAKFKKVGEEIAQAEDDFWKDQSEESSSDKNNEDNDNNVSHVLPHKSRRSLRLRKKPID